MANLIDDVRKYGLATLGTLGGVVQDLAKAGMKDKEDNFTDKEDDSDKVPGGNNEDSAASGPVPTQAAVEDPKSLQWDPYAIIEQLGYKDKPSAITYGTLKSIMYKMPIIDAIVQTRINQVASFCRPQHDKYSMGFRVKLRDTEKEPTPQDKKWAQEMEAIIMRTGVTDNPRGRDTFETFARKVMWDTLVYDAMSFEIVENRMGQPAEWYAVDASTIRLADTASTHVDEDDTEAVRYVQIYDSMIIAEYTQAELCYGVRNPRSDIWLHGYGVSELERMITTVTSLLYGFQYNQNFFTMGSAPKGIINFKGAVPDKQLQAFRRHWYNMISDASNSWRTPIMNSEDLQYVTLNQSSRDMEFSAWLDFLIKICCAEYMMDPEEVNFKYGTTGQKSSLGDSNNIEKITESKEKGLRPLLRFLEDKINRSIIHPINEAFELEFVGLNAKTRDDQADLNTKLVKSIRTIDELRAEEDLEPLPDGQGEIILDPVFLQNVQGQMGGEEEGGFGEEGDEDDEFSDKLKQFEDGDDEDKEEKEEKDDNEPGKPPKGGAEKDKDKKNPFQKSWVVEI